MCIKGPKGEISKSLPGAISWEEQDGRLSFTRSDDTKQSKSFHGLARALANNMVAGVTEGFARALEIEGVGFRAEVKGKVLVLNLGFSHPVEVEIPEGLSASTDGPTKLKISGVSKEDVGQFAADIRRLRPPEPYKGKGIRYEGEQIRRKAGKTAGAAG
jgi:large subunit ribosomal protein L6